MKQFSTCIAITVLPMLMTLVPETSAEVNVSSFTEAPDDLRMNWTEVEEGSTYTIQERSSLTGGNWTDLSTRYGWPLPVNNWYIQKPGATRNRNRYYRIVSQPIQLPDRGKLLDVTLIGSFSVGASISLVEGAGAPTDEVLFPVNYYKVTYETVDPYGQAILASAALFVPQNVGEPIPTVSYQHGTEFYKPWVPSQDDSVWFPRAVFFASAGYLMCMPDYLGLGDSPGFHPFYHAKTLATSVVDMLRAVNTYCGENNIALNEQLFLTGFSLGGYATVAAQRELEALHQDEFTVVAAAPIAGPYDLTFSWYNNITNPSYPQPEHIFYIMASWMPIYDLGGSLNEMFAATYRASVLPLLDGTHTFGEVVNTAQLASTREAFNEDYYAALVNDTEHPFRLALQENSVLDWAPQAPVRLLHCEADRIIPIENALVAEESFTDAGACCVAVIEPNGSSSLSHGLCFWPSFVITKDWFDTMRE